MSEKDKPKKGDWVKGRWAEKGTHEDDLEFEGVVVGLPRKGNDGYYDVVGPDSARKAYPMHPDGIKVVPDEQLSDYKKEHKKALNDLLNGQK